MFYCSCGSCLFPVHMMKVNLAVGELLKASCRGFILERNTFFASYA